MYWESGNWLLLAGTCHGDQNAEILIGDCNVIIVMEVGINIWSLVVSHPNVHTHLIPALRLTS